MNLWSATVARISINLGTYLLFMPLRIVGFTATVKHTGNFDPVRAALSHYRQYALLFALPSLRVTPSSQTGRLNIERSAGIEPASSAWKAEVIAIIR
jgi:hypothetical protein